MKKKTNIAAPPTRWRLAALVAAGALLSPSLAAAQEIDPEAIGQLLDPGKIATSLLIMAVAYILSGLTTAGFDNLGERLAARRLLLKRFASLTRFAIYISAATIIVVGVLKPDQQTLLTLSATLAVAVGLALKDLTGSIIAGVIVLLDSPFQVGDRVQFGDTYGEVVEIGLRTVKINTLDDNLVSIPNNKFLTDAVASSNAGALDMMVVLDFLIGVDDDHDTARRIVEEATLTSKFVYLRKPVAVHVLDVRLDNTVATRIQSKFYVSDTRYETSIKTDITQRVKRTFARLGIGSPFLQHRPIDRTRPADVGRPSAEPLTRAAARPASAQPITAPRLVPHAAPANAMLASPPPAPPAADIPEDSQPPRADAPDVVTNALDEVEAPPTEQVTAEPEPPTPSAAEELLAPDGRASEASDAPLESGDGARGSGSAEAASASATVAGEPDGASEAQEPGEDDRGEAKEV